MVAKYWVAQRIDDLFRNEPRNIGVFLQVGGSMVARFFGETGDSQIDGRKLKEFAYPEVYKQWVDYWRCQISANDPNILVRSSGSHYRVIEAGEVSDIDHDSPEDVLNYLYALLVSEGGFKEAMGEAEQAEERIALEDDISRTLHAGTKDDSRRTMTHDNERRVLRP